jgi:glycosyltransferase involved in cell wall biosynthesis
MIIGVDAHVFSGMFQGSRTYLFYLYKALFKIDQVNKYFVFGHWNGQTPFGENIQHIDFSSCNRLKRLTYQTAPLIKQFNLDVYHSTFISPIILPCKSLLTVLDILYETNPHFFEIQQRLRNKFLVRYSLSKASQVHTISQFCRKSIIDFFGVSPESVKVIPCGVDLDKFSPDRRSESVQSINSMYGVKDYILTVGRLEPRKNHIGLLKAYSLLKQKITDIGPLVIVGQKDFGYGKIFQLIRELNLSNNVIILDDIEDNILPQIYRAAKLFVYPSFAEGFGIPPLEAMSSGVPVVTSNTTSIPEVVGDAGLLIDPTDFSSIYEAMLQILTNEEFAGNLSILGRKQAGNFTWEKSAEKYLAAIESLGE